MLGRLAVVDALHEGEDLAAARDALRMAGNRVLSGVRTHVREGHATYCRPCGNLQELRRVFRLKTVYGLARYPFWELRKEDRLGGLNLAVGARH